jgi:murein endopeptidase
MVPEPVVEPLAGVSPKFGDALAGIIDRQFLASQNWQKQQWRADRRGAHPDLIEFEKVFIRKMGKLGVPMFSHEFIRSPERQNEVFRAGNSRAKGGHSAHQYGCAVDIVHSTKAWNMEPKAWALVGHVGKEIIAQKGLAVASLAWGGDWGFYDPAHWQVVDWKSLKGGYPWLT